MHRRTLLQAIAAAGGAALTPVARAAPLPRTLILLELNGGNDGLNTVVPYADPAYSVLRPKIAIKRDQVLQLDDHVGLHGALEPLQKLWRAGDLAVVQGLGYPRANRSHFRSIEIWDTASDADEYLQQGWIANVLASSGIARDSDIDAVVLGRAYPGPVASADMRMILMRSPKQFLRRAKRMVELQSQSRNSALGHLLKVRSNVFSSAASIEAAMQATTNLVLDAPSYDSNLGKQLASAARLIIGGANVPAIKVSLTGFDTHAGQAGKHRSLLTELGGALSAFAQTLQLAQRWDDVIVATYSEFGRRAHENGSGGTDHGTAAPHLVLGGRVRGGLYGQTPSLRTLDGGDLRYTVDFRNYYASIAREWWNVSPAAIRGTSAKTLGIIS
jgi:uncharacterized protein (DUF1501 family)